jgi:anti-sigma-K factor RskA
MTIIKRLGLAGALASTLALGACAETNEMIGRNTTTWSLEASKDVPSAKGKVEVAGVDKGNRDVKVETKHLAPADTAFPGMSTYVVWLKPVDGKPINVGVLTPDKKMNAELKTKTPFTTFEIMVTAENGSQPLHPSTTEVMSAKVTVPT